MVTSAPGTMAADGSFTSTVTIALLWASEITLAQAANTSSKDRVLFMGPIYTTVPQSFSGSPAAENSDYTF